ncbi:MAG TPA: hypothetical protein VME22_32870 [Solirubrobacteraceae bacterium]|nr:hypothetical protein [Solirubrobacteraceae bacterium]
MCTVAELSSVDCLVLHGDPGIGKSTVLASEQRRLTEEGKEILSLDLADIADINDLTTQLFASQAWTRWRDDSSHLILFLDTLDNALLRIPTLRRALVRELGRVDTSRLQLRIACRGVDWPTTLTEDLSRLWTSPPSLRYLLPLRPADVEHAAAEAPGVDPDAFVSQVLERGVVPLATSPLTLGLLLRTMAADGALPATQTETYRRGLLLLCEEPDRERADNPQTGGTLSAGARMAVAERLAAAVLLSGAVSVWDGPDDGQAPATSIVRGTLTGGTEEDDSGAVPASVQVNENAVRESLRTATFAGRSGTAELVFAHQSFGEFLAARWLGRLGFERAASVLCLPNDPARPLVPQLREVAAWLGLLNPDALAHLLESGDVELLLRPDLGQQPPETRAAVLEGVVALLARGVIGVYDGPLRDRLRYLNGPQIPDQLRTILTDPERSEVARQFACMVAGACRLPELTDSLIDVAHDRDAGGRLRTEAVLSIEPSADDSERARLIDLISEEIDDHDGDELKGAVLELVWPDVLSAQKLFASITPPRDPDTLGLYRAFLGSRLVAGLAEADLVIALDWAGDHYHPYGLGDFADLALQIMVRAWPEITSNPEIADRFGQIACRLLADHLVLLQYAMTDTEELFVTEAGRREIVVRLVDAVAAAELEPTSLVHADPALLLPTDLPWVLDRLTDSLGAEHERVWALLANQIWTYEDDASAAAIWEGRETSTELETVTAPRFEAVEIDSPLAAQNRSWYERSQRIQQQRAEQHAEQLAWDASIAQRLTHALSDPATAWPELSSLLTGARRDPPLQEARHLTVDSPGYAHLDPDARRSLIDAAEHFLRGAHEPDGSVDLNLVTATSIAAVRAMDLLLEKAPDRLAALEPDLWARWSHAVLVHPIEGGAKGDALAQLQRRATAADPLLVASQLLGVLRVENHRNGRAWQLEHADALASAELESGLLGMLNAGGILPDAVADVISFGIRRRSEPLRTWALAIIARVGELHWASQDYAIAKRVAAVVVDRAPDLGWPAVWAAMQRSEPWAREVIHSLVDNRNHAQFAALDEATLAELYVWVRQRYPVSEDPPASGLVGARGRLAWWRDALPNALAGRATEQAGSELGALVARFPDDQYLKRLHADAEAAQRRGAWRPPRPQAVIQLGINRSSRLVSSDLDLQDVVLEALGRVQQRLRPPTPAAPDIWESGMPKEEDAISDWLQRQLQDELGNRLVVIDREVQVMRFPGPGIGERTDLLVQGVAGRGLGDAETVATVIEVKGCWNRDLSRDMDRQLARRYLVPDGRRCGIYLIVWFGTSGWTAQSDRRKAPCGTPPDELTAEYEQQARTVSTSRGLEIRAMVLDGSLPPPRR